MKTRYLLLILVFLVIQGLQGNLLSLIGRERKKMDFLALKIAEDISDDYGALIFTPDHPKPLPAYSIFVERILQKSPSIVTKVNQPGHTETFFFNKYHSFGAITYIVLYQVENSTEELLQQGYLGDKGYRFMTNVIKTFHFYQEVDRLKCLFIIFDKVINYKFIQKYTEYYWNNHEILDLSVIAININNISSAYELHYLVPFKRIHVKKTIRRNTILFPNELVDANGYKFDVKVPEKLKLEKNGVLHNASRYEETAVSLIIIALKKLNFTLKIPEPESIIDRFYDVLFTSNKKNKTLFEAPTDLELESKPLMYITNKANTRLYCFYDCEKVIAVVSVYANLNLQYPNTLFIYGGIICVIICVTLCTGILFSNNDRFWHSFNIFELLTGASIEAQPRNIIQKIFFLCFAFISMVYMADFYSDILGIKYIRQIEKFDTFKQLYDYNFDVYINPSYKFRTIPDDWFDWHHNKTFYSHNMYADKIIKSSQSLEKIDKCLKKIGKNHRVMCISSEIEFANKLDETMKIPEPVFYCTNAYYKMKSYSPYRYKLQRIVDRLFETGIPEYLKQPNNITDLSPQDSELDMTRKIIIIVFIGGCSISLLTFVMEVMAAFYKSKNNFRVDDTA